VSEARPSGRAFLCDEGRVTSDKARESECGSPRVSKGAFVLASDKSRAANLEFGITSELLPGGKFA
jgi:hypothetical protein